MILFAVQKTSNSGLFLGYDNKGAMATGYPMWVDITKSPNGVKLYNSYDQAEKDIQSLDRYNYEGPCIRQSKIVKFVIDVQPGEGIREAF